MKNLLIIVGLLIILTVAFYFTQKTMNGGSISLPGFGTSSKIVIKDKTFKLLVAKTEKEKETGLSGKKSLAQDTGMLFPYEQKATPTFWMRGMQFPIDIIFINDGKIVTLYKNAKPPSSDQNLSLYRPTQPIDNVLEINAGLSEKYGFNEGDAVQITL
ncbi:MAG: DUF192 domain-containing protein [bacterium]|nr:DUF192 domain-containing protein [bacterium]